MGFIACKILFFPESHGEVLINAVVPSSLFSNQCLSAFFFFLSPSDVNQVILLFFPVFSDPESTGDLLFSFAICFFQTVPFLSHGRDSSYPLLLTN